MNDEAKTKYLCQFLTEQRLQLIDEKLRFRTRHITLVLEDIFQSQNGAACLRSAEAFGIQDIHVIENRNRFSIHKDVLRGASKWLTIHRYNKEENNTSQCLSALVQKGYQLVATTPHTSSLGDEILTEDQQTESNNNLAISAPVPLHTFDVTPKIALMFGTEKTGLTQEAMEMAEAFLTIPMTGFTESLNLSASAAIALYTLTHKLKQSTFRSTLSDRETVQLRGEWIRKSLGYRLEKLEREYDRRNVCSEESNK